jgi:putative transcriptional regulator
MQVALGQADDLGGGVFIKSDAFEVIHSAVEGLYQAGKIDKATMRSFDESCLTVPADFEPEEIKALRESNHVSQPVFARYLNTSEATVQKHGLQVLA